MYIYTYTHVHIYIYTIICTRIYVGIHTPQLDANGKGAIWVANETRGEETLIKFVPYFLKNWSLIGF